MPDKNCLADAHRKKLKPHEVQCRHRRLVPPFTEVTLGKKVKTRLDSELHIHPQQIWGVGAMRRLLSTGLYALDQIPAKQARLSKIKEGGYCNEYNRTAEYFYELENENQNESN
jgi:hypothetical protein